MKLARHILSNLKLDQRLLNQGKYTVAALALVESYNTLTQPRAGWVELTPQDTATELCVRLERLVVTEQIRLLHYYNETVQNLELGSTVPMPLLTATGAPVPPALDPTAQAAVEAAREERKLKTWLIKSGFWAVVSIFWVLVGAMVVIGVRSGTMPDGAVVNSIMSTATEILKLIFSL